PERGGQDGRPLADDTDRLYWRPVRDRSPQESLGLSVGAAAAGAVALRERIASCKFDRRVHRREARGERTLVLGGGGPTDVAAATVVRPDRAAADARGNQGRAERPF